MKKFVFAALSIFFGLAVCVLLLEIVFRILPVRPGVEANDLDNPVEIATYKKNRDFTFSSGKTFNPTVKKHSNNYGFLSDIDYKKNPDRPLVAVIGDSFVAAIRVKNSNTVGGRLGRAVDNEGSVYSFGRSGYPLAGYLAFANYTKKEFSPEAAVFIIIFNDFDQSLCSYYHGGFKIWCFEETSDGLKNKLMKNEENTSLVDHLRNIGRRSALLRYVFLHLNIKWRILFKEKKTDTNIPDARLSEVSDEVLIDSKKAIDAFFRLLPDASGLAEDKILFVLDSCRSMIYSNMDVSQCYFQTMREYFMGKAKNLGYEFIDTHPVFQKDYAENGKKFEFKNNFHWNELGNFLVAQEVANSRMFKMDK